MSLPAPLAGDSNCLFTCGNTLSGDQHHANSGSKSPPNDVIPIGVEGAVRQIDSHIDEFRSRRFSTLCSHVQGRTAG